jgi:hypothetical protein
MNSMDPTFFHKLTVAHLIKKFVAFRSIRITIRVFTHSISINRRHSQLIYLKQHRHVI